MKINWGTALLIFFILYVGNLVRVVIKSRTIDHSLVVENYYEHDINYQDKLDKIKNRQLLSQDLKIGFTQSEKQLNLDFGGASDYTKALVELYRPSDKSADLIYNIDNPQQKSNIDLKNLKPGKWKIKVEWNDELRAYFKEQDLYIQNL